MSRLERLDNPEKTVAEVKILYETECVALEIHICFFFALKGYVPYDTYIDYF